MKDVRNYSLKAHNTFGIEASCSRYIEYADVEEAQEVARILRTEEKPFLIIGGGSNLLLTRDFDGIVVRSANKSIRTEKTRVECGSGTEWDTVVDYCIKHGLFGAENLSLIPGDVGATAVQNIGAYGAEVSNLIERVWAVEIETGEVRVISKESCQYGYRQSRFKQEWKNKYLITQVDYQLSTTFTPLLDYGNIRAELASQDIASPTAQQLRDVIISIRRAKLPDPKDTGNAGSFFMNPIVSRQKFNELAKQHPGIPHFTVDEQQEKIPAGWMIEQCGWKGRALGHAGVHAKQALVLVNLGGATGAEIIALCKAIQHDVQEKFGIEIKPEVNIV